MFLLTATIACSQRSLNVQKCLKKYSETGLVQTEGLLGHFILGYANVSMRFVVVVLVVAILAASEAGKKKKSKLEDMLDKQNEADHERAVERAKQNRLHARQERQKLPPGFHVKFTIIKDVAVAPYIFMVLFRLA